MQPKELVGDYLIEFLPDTLPHGVADPHLMLARVYVAGDPPAGTAYLKRRAILMRTSAEALVYVLAHELRHLEQHERMRPTRNVPKERDADAYAAHCLRRWRRLQPLREGRLTPPLRASSSPRAPEPPEGRAGPEWRPLCCAAADKATVKSR